MKRLIVIASKECKAQRFTFFKDGREIWCQFSEYAVFYQFKVDIQELKIYGCFSMIIKGNNTSFLDCDEEYEGGIISDIYWEDTPSDKLAIVTRDDLQEIL